MIDDSLQFQIHNGSQEAFLEMSRLCAKDIYLTALGASGQEDLSRMATKNALLRFRRALIASEGPVDSDVVLSELLEEELGMPLYPLPAIPDSTGSDLSYDADSEKKSPPSPSSDPASHSAHRRQSRPKRMIQQNEPVSFDETHPSISLADRWIIAASVFFLFCLIWTMIGILMDLSILAPVNLGYGWFNRNLFPLFHSF